MNQKKALFKIFTLFDHFYTRLRYSVEVNQSLKKIKTSKLTAKEKKEIEAYYKKFQLKHVNCDWHKLYKSINGTFDVKYIPEDLFYTRIEPALNRLKEFNGIQDKNLLSVFFSGIKQPETIINNKNGFFFDSKNKLISSNIAMEKCFHAKKFIVKPSFSCGQGQKLKLVNIPNEGCESFIQDLFLEYQKDFIIQSVIVQHKKFRDLNESSVNTIRVFSYLSNNKVHILSKYVRVGGKDEIADNSNKRSLACGIRNNRYLTYAVDDSGRKLFQTETGCDINNYEIPDITGLLAEVKLAHRSVPYFKLISWDLCIDESDTVVLIEFNVKWQDIIAYQMLYNSPLFGEFTDEILNFTRIHWQEISYA